VGNRGNRRLTSFFGKPYRPDFAQKNVLISQQALLYI